MSSCITSATRIGRHVRGVTLVELLVTVAVAAILAMIAVPAMQDTLATRAVSSSADDLAAALRQARSEALKRGMPVSVCATSDPNAASAACATVPWTSGWLVFTDQDANGDLGTGEQLVHVFSGGRSVGSISEADDNAFVTFAANGLLKDGTHRQWALDPKSGTTDAAKRVVCLNLAGRVKVVKPEDGC